VSRAAPTFSQECSNAGGPFNRRTVRLNSVVPDHRRVLKTGAAGFAFGDLGRLAFRFRRASLKPMANQRFFKRHCGLWVTASHFDLDYTFHSVELIQTTLQWRGVIYE
jgi:hypothetical protein